MKPIKPYSHVRLKDGREGTVVEIFGKQEDFMIDLGDPSKPLPDDWLPTVKREAIVEIIWEPKD